MSLESIKSYPDPLLVGASYKDENFTKALQCLGKYMYDSMCDRADGKKLVKQAIEHLEIFLVCK